MMSVSEYMTKSPHTIDAQEPLVVARRFMSESRVRHLPVLQGGALVGMLSNRELESLATLPGSSHLTVEEAMTPDVYVTSGDASLAAVADEMARRHIGSAIVVGHESTEVLGVFTVDDALRALADALRSRSATGG